MELRHLVPRHHPARDRLWAARVDVAEVPRSPCHRRQVSNWLRLARCAGPRAEAHNSAAAEGAQEPQQHVEEVRNLWVGPRPGLHGHLGADAASGPGEAHLAGAHHQAPLHDGPVPMNS